MALKPTMELKLGQQLSLTPQLQQAISLLQLTSIELQQKIQQALEENPLLDINEEQQDDEDDESDTTTATAETSTTLSAEKAAKSKATDIDNLIEQEALGETIQDYLLWQCNFVSYSDEERNIANAIIEAVGDDGLLTCSLESICDSLEQTVKLSDVENVLQCIQTFDPPGVAARNLRECLLLQLKQLPEDTGYLNETRDIITESFELLAKHNYQHIIQKHKLSQEKLTEIISLIKSLNPRPGSKINETKTD